MATAEEIRRQREAQECVDSIAGCIKWMWRNSDYRFICCTVQGQLKLTLIWLSLFSLATVVSRAEGSFLASAGRPQLFALVSVVCVCCTCVSFLIFCCYCTRRVRCPWMLADFGYLSALAVLYVGSSYVYFWEHFPVAEALLIVPTMLLYIVTAMMAFRDYRLEYRINPPTSYEGTTPEDIE